MDRNVAVIIKTQEFDVDVFLRVLETVNYKLMPQSVSCQNDHKNIKLQILILHLYFFSSTQHRE